MSRQGKSYLIFSEVELVILVVLVGTLLRDVYHAPINWSVVAIKFGYFLVAALLITVLTYWLERTLKKPIWHIAALWVAFAAGMPLEAIFVPVAADPLLGFFIGLGLALILAAPVLWVLLLECRPKTEAGP